jgi:hypothetical protein
MNEQIEILAEQAEKYADYNFKGEHFWTEAYEAKFAELIVLECANVADKYVRHGDIDIARIIKRHFGVEE